MNKFEHKKIAFFTHGSDYLGANRSLVSLVKELNRQDDFECIIVTPSFGLLIDVCRNEKIEVEVFKYFPWMFTKNVSRGYWLRHFYKNQNKSCLDDLKKYLEKNKVTHIYSNTSAIGIGAFAAEAMNLPHIWHIREFGEEHYNSVNIYGESIFLEYLEKASLVIYISNALAQKFSEIKVQKKLVIWDGILTLESREDRDEDHQSDNEENMNFLIAGLLHPNKGQFEALKAYRKTLENYRNNSLTIIGSGRRTTLLKLKVFKWLYSLQNVKILSFTKDIDQYFKDADIYLMCSKYEALGRVTIEAMNHGLPVIGKNSGATIELIQHGENGYLYKTKMDLVTYMNKLSKSKTLRTRMGKKGKKFAQQNFLIENYGINMMKILRDS